MKILLVLASPDNDPLRGRHPFMPLSLPILASAAPDHTYFFHDMLWEKSNPDYSMNIDLVGISYRISGEKTAFSIADKFRKLGKKVILGGPQPTVNPLDAKQHADGVSVGEGEVLWPKILEDVQSNTLKDFYVTYPNQLDANGYSVHVESELPDIKKFPIPNRRLFNHRYSFDMVYAAKGCPVNCDFCIVTDIYGKVCRTRDISDVVNEIDTLNKFFYLIDETVFGRANTFDFYSELYTKIQKLKRKRFWTGQGNLDAATSEKGKKVIQKAAKSGLTYVAIGIESINQKSLQASGAIKKAGVSDQNDHIAAIENNIRFIQHAGIAISAWFAIGYPSDNLNTYSETVDFCNKNHIFPVITPVHALPGSRLYKRLKDEDYLQDPSSNITNVKHSNIHNEDILTGMYYNRNKGYTIRQILKNTLFYLKIFRKTERSFNDIINKTIFTFVTQLKLKNIIAWEIKRMEQIIGKK